MVHCACGVMAAVAAKIPISVFQGVYSQNYTSALNPKHKSPHALKINRISEVLIDGAVLEFTRIVKEQRKKLCFGFISLTTNFVTDPNHHQSFGVVLLNLVAQKYKLVDGQDLFMSKETADRISDKLQSGFATKALLEYPANMEHFSKPKTIDNVVEWLTESHKAIKVVSSDFNQMAADGASNAIGSILESEVQTCTERANDIDLSICHAHQNELAGGYASGTHKYAKPVNIDLGEILEKSHVIQVCLNCAKSRMDVVRAIQKKNKHDPVLAPKPANDTRWNGCHDETKHANMIMGYVCLAIKEFLSPEGDDCDLLTPDEIANGDYDRLTYTDSEKMILRQFKSTSVDAKQFSLFMQEKGNTNAHLLFQIQMVLQQSKAEYFRMMYANAICVLQEGATLSIEETAKYHEVVEMHKLIATYRDKYANDLSHCLEIDKCHLPSAYTFMAY
ncbi:hypothetical protein ACHAWX_000792 [Stephanocyclus meneghinianus]